MYNREWNLVKFNFVVKLNHLFHNYYKIDISQYFHEFLLLICY